MKTFGQISSSVISRAKIESSDSISIANLLVDANDAQSIIASMRDWDELWKTGTLSLLLADGDKNYSLATDVDKIELVRITSPVDYAKKLNYELRKIVLARIGSKSNNGTGTPSSWYYSEPTIAAGNSETKNMSFNIMPDQAYTVTYDYKKYPGELSLSTDYPFFDQNFHHVIEYYCLWKYSERNPDQTLDPAYFRGEWENSVQQLLSQYYSKVADNLPIPGPDHYA